MIYETRKYVDILIKLNITPRQFLLAWLIYNKQWPELKDYMEHFGPFAASEIRDLEDKDIILNTARDSKTYLPAHLIVTERFAGEMVISPEDAWDELMEKYPGKVNVNGTHFASKGLTLSDERECRERYIKFLKGNKYVHTNILALVEKWKNDNGGFATMKIDKFVIGEFWKEIETERSGHVGPALY